VSAWVVHNAHIDVVVQALCEREIVLKDPTEVGQVLLDENLRSCGAKHTEPYTFTRPPTAIPLCWVHAAASVYLYQLAEYPTWEQSQAAIWVSELVMRLGNAGIYARGYQCLPESYHPDGYETGYGESIDAEHPPWGITRGDFHYLRERNTA